MDCVIIHKYMDCWQMDQMDRGTMAMSVYASAGVVGTTVWSVIV